MTPPPPPRSEGPGPGGRDRGAGTQQLAGTLGDSAQAERSGRVLRPSARPPRADPGAHPPRRLCALGPGAPGDRPRRRVGKAAGGGTEPRSRTRRAAGPGPEPREPAGAAGRLVARRPAAGSRAERPPGLGPGVVPASRTGFVTWESGRGTLGTASPLFPPAARTGTASASRRCAAELLRGDRTQEGAPGSELSRRREQREARKVTPRRVLGTHSPPSTGSPDPPGGAARTSKPFVFTPREVSVCLLKLENRIMQPQNNRDPEEGAGPRTPAPDGQGLLEKNFVDKLLKQGKKARLPPRLSAARTSKCIKLISTCRREALCCSQRPNGIKEVPSL
ncbi:translation initiation factor IF-2-like [Mustela putorius furo]|uniref:Translation initiation factor IF-2-like n=1 Tax=Mustela putorius furo TaxID=9669 RepID=A0A8U0SGP9_MUSPF|nr:translation initiation factor IF-2-like [Mustela putorius furo]